MILSSYIMYINIMINFLLRFIYVIMSFCARPLVGTGIVHWGIFGKLDQLHAKIFRKMHT